MQSGIANERFPWKSVQWREIRSQHSQRMHNARNFTYLVRGPWRDVGAFKTVAQMEIAPYGIIYQWYEYNATRTLFSSFFPNRPMFPSDGWVTTCREKNLVPNKSLGMRTRVNCLFYIFPASKHFISYVSHNCLYSFYFYFVLLTLCASVFTCVCGTVNINYSGCVWNGKGSSHLYLETK